MCDDLKRLNHLLGEIDGTYHDISLKLGLSDSVSKVLYTLALHGNRCPLRLLSRQTGLSKQTVHSAIRMLERQGLARLEPADGKNKDVQLTKAGAAYAEQTAARIITMENRILERWTPQEARQYLDLTEKFLHDLQEEREKL